MFLRRCVGEPHIVQYVNADLIRAGVAPTNSNTSGRECHTDSADGSRSSTKYETYQVSVSWDMVRRPWHAGGGVSGHRAELSDVVHDGSLCVI